MLNITMTWNVSCSLQSYDFHYFWVYLDVKTCEVFSFVAIVLHHW